MIDKKRYYELCKIMGWTIFIFAIYSLGMIVGALLNKMR